MTNFYAVGGTIPPDSPSYIKRKADDDLYHALKTGQFCYVLNSRQMGKSSLWVRTQQKLIKEGFKCANIDLIELSKDNQESWYRGLFYQLVKAFDVSITQQRQTWWNERADVSPINRLNMFIEEILLKEIEQKIIISLDEIDNVLSLNFSSDAFFSWMRSCHEKRQINPIYQRLTFCILGVATPSNFIRDNARSPFNIGQSIPLFGFTKGEALELAKGLEGKVSDPKQVLEYILEWTNGQPFLTQKICYLIFNSRKQAGESPINVQEFVQSNIINNWQSNDRPVHLSTIQNRLLSVPSTARRLLILYQEILEKGQIKSNSTPDQIELRLTGLVTENNGNLQVYNRIYRNIFNETWVKAELDKIPPFIEKYEIWVNSAEDNTKLLSGEELQEALTWSEDKSLNDAENRFLQLSKIEEKRREQIARQREAYQLAQTTLTPEFSDENQRNLLINEILAWTGNQLGLVKIVCQLIIKNKNNLNQGKEKEFIESLIQENIINNWSQGEASELLTNVKNNLLTTEENIRAKLETYQDILQGRVFADNKPEKLALQQAELVIKNEDYLEVANRIYKEVFNLQWVNQELEKLVTGENSPASLTVIASLIAIVAFIGFMIWLISKPKSDPLVIPTQSPSEILQICTQRNVNNPLENDIKELEKIKNQQGDQFIELCQNQLRDLKLIQDAIGLARNNYIIKSPSNDQKGAFSLLCEIPKESSNIDEARYWANRWYNNTNNWKSAIDSFVKDHPECRYLIEPSDNN